MIGRLQIPLTAVVLAAGGLAAQDGKKSDKDKLQGEWAVVSMDVVGKAVDAERLKKRKVVIKGDEWVETTPDGKERKFTLKIDPTKSPKELDITSKRNKQVTQVGIYKLEGDTLTVCRVAALGVERPKEFKAGGTVVLAVYKRSGK